MGPGFLTLTDSRAPIPLLDEEPRHKMQYPIYAINKDLDAIINATTGPSHSWSRTSFCVVPYRAMSRTNSPHVGGPLPGDYGLMPRIRSVGITRRCPRTKRMKHRAPTQVLSIVLV
jgi:hypothetical protein